MFRLLRALGFAVNGFDYAIAIVEKEKMCRSYLVTNLCVLIVQGIIKLQHYQIPLEMISDFQFKQPILGRIFGYGSLGLKLTDRKEYYYLQGVLNTKALAEAIKHARHHN